METTMNYSPKIEAIALWEPLLKVNRCLIVALCSALFKLLTFQAYEDILSAQ